MSARGTRARDPAPAAADMPPPPTLRAAGTDESARGEPCAYMKSRHLNLTVAANMLQDWELFFLMRLTSGSGLRLEDPSPPARFPRAVSSTIVRRSSPLRQKVGVRPNAGTGGIANTVSGGGGTTGGGLLSAKRMSSINHN